MALANLIFQGSLIKESDLLFWRLQSFSIHFTKFFSQVGVLKYKQRIKSCGDLNIASDLG